MRLIDAEKLREQFIALYSNRECLTEKDSVLVECVDLIDNAPTVELQSCVAKVTLSEEQLNEIVARVTEKTLSERLLEVANEVHSDF